ncbi:MAG: hypothetical protein WA667_04830 [Candidatus Nitrosopolaris sp.]
MPWYNGKKIKFDVRTGEVRNPPADTPQSVYEVKVENNDILIRKNAQGQPIQYEITSEATSRGKRASTVYELTLLEKKKLEGTDIMSFKFSRQSEQQGGPNNDNKTYLDYTAGQFAFFDIGGVSHDPKGPIRHFTIASSTTEDFIMISTRIRDTPYKKRLSSLEEGVKVKVRGPEGKFVLHEDNSKAAVLLSGGIGARRQVTKINYPGRKKF